MKCARRIVLDFVLAAVVATFGELTSIDWTLLSNWGHCTASRSGV